MITTHTLHPAPLDGTTPTWVHHPSLPDRRKDRPRAARVAPMTATTMTLEAQARALTPSAGMRMPAVEHIFHALTSVARGRHLAPVTEDTIARAYGDFLTVMQEVGR